MDAFKAFLQNNNVIPTASAMTFGVATVAFVKAFVADCLLPLVYLSISMVTRRKLRFLDKLMVNKELRFSNFVAEFITYIAILASCFLLLNYVFKRLTYGTTTTTVLSQQGKPSASPTAEMYR